MKQSHSLGQVFLNDSGYIRKINAAMDIDGRPVVEIGPGDGRMTERLLLRAKSLLCVELDRRWCDVLNKRFVAAPNLKVVCADILGFPLDRQNEKVIVFGNAPYQISNELVRWLVTNRSHIEAAYLTFQKEFIDKLAAKVSTKPYGFLSCYVQYYAKIEKLFEIPARAFTPVPAVDSAFMKVTFYQQPPDNEKIEKALFAFIRQAFSGRRKKIHNSLPRLKQNPGILKTLGIVESARPENVSLEQYVALAKMLEDK